MFIEQERASIAFGNGIERSRIGLWTSCAKFIILVATLLTTTYGDPVAQTIANNLPGQHRNHKFRKSYGQLKTGAEQKGAIVGFGNGVQRSRTAYGIFQVGK